MPQLCDKPIYEECLAWVDNAITTHPSTHVLIGGDFQCNIHHLPPWMQSCLTGIRILTPPLITFHRGHFVLDHWCTSQTTKDQASSATFTTPFSNHLAISSTISFNAVVIFPPHTRSPLPMITRQYRFRLYLSPTQISLYTASTARIRAMGQSIVGTQAHLDQRSVVGGSPAYMFSG